MASSKEEGTPPFFSRQNVARAFLRKNFKGTRCPMLGLSERFTLSGVGTIQIAFQHTVFTTYPIFTRAKMVSRVPCPHPHPIMRGCPEFLAYEQARRAELVRLEMLGYPMNPLATYQESDASIFRAVFNGTPTTPPSLVSVLSCTNSAAAHSSAATPVGCDSLSPVCNPACSPTSTAVPAESLARSMAAPLRFPAKYLSSDHLSETATGGGAAGGGEAAAGSAAAYFVDFMVPPVQPNSWDGDYRQGCKIVREMVPLPCNLKLYEAVAYRDTGAIRELLGCPDIDVNWSKNRWGDSLLHVACMKRYRDVALFLLENGADPMLYNKEGVRAMDCVVHAFSMDDQLCETLQKALSRSTKVLKRISNRTRVRRRSDVGLYKGRTRGSSRRSSLRSSVK